MVVLWFSRFFLVFFCWGGLSCYFLMNINQPQRNQMLSPNQRDWNVFQEILLGTTSKVNQVLFSTLHSMQCHFTWEKRKGPHDPIEKTSFFGGLIFS